MRLNALQHTVQSPPHLYIKRLTSTCLPSSTWYTPSQASNLSKWQGSWIVLPGGHDIWEWGWNEKWGLDWSSNFPGAPHLTPEYLLIRIGGLTLINSRQASVVSDNGWINGVCHHLWVAVEPINKNIQSVVRKWHTLNISPSCVLLGSYGEHRREAERKGLQASRKNNP